MPLVCGLRGRAVCDALSYCEAKTKSSFHPLHLPNANLRHSVVEHTTQRRFGDRVCLRVNVRQRLIELDEVDDPLVPRLWKLGHVFNRASHSKVGVRLDLLEDVEEQLPTLDVVAFSAKRLLLEIYLFQYIRRTDRKEKVGASCPT